MNPPPDDQIDHATREATRPPAPQPGIGLVDDLIMALRLFSRLPAGDTPHQKPDLGRIAMALPLASVVIGLGPALLLVGGALVGLPVYYAAALAVAAHIAVTGAMADDALADAMDGLFGGHSAARRLEIMRDSRHGSYGVAALCLYALLRVTGIGAIAVASPLAAAAIWLAASIAGRSASLWPAVVLPAARSDGLSASAGRLSPMRFGVGLLFAALLLFLLAGPATSIVALIVAVVAAVVVVALWTALVRRLVGGQTGDLLGALGALVEIAMLTALLPFA